MHLADIRSLTNWAYIGNKQIANLWQQMMCQILSWGVIVQVMKNQFTVKKVYHTALVEFVLFLKNAYFPQKVTD